MSSYNYNGGGRQVGSGGGFRNSGILGVLQATQIDNKSVLPAEILFTILDHLPVPDLMRFARVSHLFREMVYDDTRWVSRLQSMGCWNEVEARRRFEEALVRRRRDTATAAAAAGGLAIARGMVGRGGGVLPSGAARAGGRSVGGSTMLFDAPLEEERRKQLLVLRQKQQEQQQQQQQKLGQVRDGFETLAIEGVGSQTAHATAAVATTADKQQPQRAVTDPLQDTEALLDVLKNVRSIRGHAREEYGRVYGALAPFFYDLVRAKSHADPAVFKVFRDPERQARMLANLQRFAHSDWAQGWRLREERLATMVGIFEAAVLREFEQGYEFWDVDGRMNKYASVLDVLNGSKAGVDLFIHKHPLFSDREVAASNDMECLRLAPAAAAATAAVASSAVWGDAASASGQSGVEDIITLEPSRQFFGRLAEKVNEQGVMIGRIFPRPATVFWAFVDKVREDIVMEYITPLLDETHERSMAAYLTAVSGLFEQCLQFFQALEPPKGAEAEKKEAEAAAAAAAAAAATTAAKAATATAGSAQAAAMNGRSKRADQTRSLYGRIGGGSLGGLGEVIKVEAEDDTDGWTVRGRVRKAKEMAYKTFEPHLDLYLQEELDFFRENAEKEVGDWDKKLSEQDASVESFFMANFNRQEVKKDFLSSFKKVVMMPVTVLPGQLLGGSSNSSSAHTSSTAAAATAASTPGSSGTATPVPAVNMKSLPDKAPDDELAAKAALMATRLEGIRSLFSIEMALNLVHTAKMGLGRAAVFVQLDGRAGGEAREQCSAIFVELLRVLGNGHVKQGFDRAVEHLSQYNPRAGGSGGSKSGSGTGAVTGTGSGEVSEAKDTGGVAPLMTFIELVNVGDLISQMIDVFYEQQLAGPKIADRNDFLDAAGLAKKRFEQMIDESVAAGLNKGIDVLMDEVEYICATTQKPTDYYPEAADAVAEGFLFSLNGARASVIGGVGGGTSAGASTPKSKRASSPAGSEFSAFAAAASSGSGAGSGSGNSAFASASASASASTGGSGGSTSAVLDIGPTRTALRVVELVRGHTNMLKGSTEKTMLEVFNGEVGLRLFTAVCKHLKRQRISMAGAVHVIADMTLYFDYVRTLRNTDLLAYFRALRELSQLYLIDAKHHAKEMAVIIADNDRFGGVFRAEEVYEFAERRADWYQVKRDVERAMYGLECAVM
ncbi:secretion pathway protein sls2 [Grosmannia clavigera kw1407]|uniref:Secretion pathway protein sls2 n=1 Tax=Grosmannia clavigera (strain kw1407 / UAMH 11150) TaxID=655863 RepID=F0XMA9_GROCL|nr:secretion pathway protein sls2 [Grosmannia clavigera kw1407]EFX01117.1 secretion pathway protein sls2 [Grosmannia clavigera kw1407]